MCPAPARPLPATSTDQGHACSATLLTSTRAFSSLSQQVGHAAGSCVRQQPEHVQLSLWARMRATADVLNILGTCCLSKQEAQEQHVAPDHLLQGWWQEWCCL